jgi:hypothetical protein
LDFDEKAQVARNVTNMLQIFGGQWITCDITTDSFMKTQAKNIPGHDETLSKLVGKTVNVTPFDSLDHAQNFFQKFGLRIEFYPFLDIREKLSSPAKLGCTEQVTNELIEHAVVAVMELSK